MISKLADLCWVPKYCFVNDKLQAVRLSQKGPENVGLHNFL